VASTKEFESNRTEILRLLLTFASKSMYMSAGAHSKRSSIDAVLIM
jgi:hypothetical protein